MDPGTPRAWWLNFDADEELARPRGYRPSPRVVARFPALAVALGPLLAPGDVVLATETRVAPGAFAGRAFCPTPSALAALRDAGAGVPDAPDLATLRAVNDRAFCAALDQPLPGGRFARTLDELEEATRSPSPSGAWLLKRAFGFAGRGQRRLAGALDAGAKAWAAASLRAGEGLQVEPWAPRRGDFGLHGHLDREAALVLGEPTVQTCDETGAWRGSRRATPGELERAEAQALVASATTAGEALRRAGYFGPYGVDAFRWADPAGHLHFNPRCEINARYSMGWAVGMGDRRPDLD